MFSTAANRMVTLSLQCILQYTTRYHTLFSAESPPITQTYLTWLESLENVFVCDSALVPAHKMV